MDNLMKIKKKARKATEFVKKLQQWKPCIVH